MLLNFLAARDLDLREAAEADLLAFRLWRREEAEETIGQATRDRDAAAIGRLYDYLAQVGYIAGRPWRPPCPRMTVAERRAGQVRARLEERQATGARLRRS
jgi:hypothetical protein